ncbi:MAG: hypothetical protein ABR536_07410 [Solirubrobacterales bacterium]
MVLFVVGFVIVLPQPPAPDASAASVASYYTDHQDAIRIAVLIISAALLFFIWFLGSLSSALRLAIGSPRLPMVAFAGGIIGAAFFLIALTVTATAALRPEETSPEVVRALNDIGLVVGAPAAPGFVALFAATALVIARSNALPQWLCAVNVVGAVASLGALGAMFTTTGAFAADGALGLFVPVTLGFIVPIAADSIVLYRHVGSAGLSDRTSGAAGRAPGQ